MIWICISAVVFAVVSWLNRQAGLWILLASLPLYLVRFEILSMPTTLLEVFIYITALVFIAKNLRGLWSRILKTFLPIGWPAALILVGLIIGTAVSPDLRLSLGIFKGWFVDSAIFYFLVVNIVDWRKVEHYILALLLTTLPMSGLAVWQAATGNFITVDGRASAWFVSANYLSMYLVPILILGAVVWLSRNKLYKGVAMLGWLLGLAALYVSFSYGGWVGLLGALLVGAAVYYRAHWKVWIWGALIPVLAFVSQLGNERFMRMLDLSERSSASVRIQVWQTGLLMIKENWLTGIGLGQFRDQYLAFANRAFSPPWELAILHAHNLLLQFMVNLGIVGTAGFIWLIVQFFRWFRGHLGPMATTLIAAMSAILIHGLIDTTYWKNDLSALFWIILALGFISNQRERISS